MLPPAMTRRHRKPSQPPFAQSLDGLVACHELKSLHLKNCANYYSSNNTMEVIACATAQWLLSNEPPSTTSVLLHWTAATAPLELTNKPGRHSKAEHWFLPRHCPSLERKGHPFWLTTGGALECMEPRPHLCRFPGQPRIGQTRQLPQSRQMSPLGRGSCPTGCT
jgi:hypothetical protein